MRVRRTSIKPPIEEPKWTLQEPQRTNQEPRRTEGLRIAMVTGRFLVLFSASCVWRQAREELLWLPSLLAVLNSLRISRDVLKAPCGRPAQAGVVWGGMRWCEVAGAVSSRQNKGQRGPPSHCALLHCQGWTTAHFNLPLHLPSGCSVMSEWITQLVLDSRRRQRGWRLCFQ